MKEIDLAILNTDDNGGQSVIVSVETFKDGERLAFVAESYGSSESRIVSYTYTAEGLNDAINVLTRARDRLLEKEESNEEV